MKIETIKKSKSLVVGLDDIKAHMRLDTSHEDDLIVEYIKAATKHIENYLGKTLLTATLKAKHTQLPGFSRMPLPYGPINSIVSVKAGILSFNETKNFYIENSSAVPELVLNESAHEIEVVYLAGYGALGDSVPDDIRQAIRILIGHFYEARDTQKLPNNSVIWSLLHPYQTRRI
jgi:uncharacterized phiE125 gp8 family phage protein